MPTRTHTGSLVFQRAFSTKSAGGPHPAGTYTVETEEELVEGLSFPVYRRVSTTITRQANAAGALLQVLAIDPHELAEAQAADRLDRRTAVSPDRG